METLLEGVEASAQPCTLAVLLPSIAVVMAGGRIGLRAWFGFVIGCSLLFWARAAGHWDLDRVGWEQWLIAALILAAFGAVWRRSHAELDLTFGGAVVVGLFAGWLWRPCVGERLADILNNASTDGARTLALTPLYVTGVTLVALGLALLPLVVSRAAVWFEHVAWRGTALVFAMSYAVLVAVGAYDDVVAELLQRSTA